METNKNCVKCGLCAERCPVQAINPDDFRIDSGKCNSCMHHVKQCRANARKANGVMISIETMAIKKPVQSEKKMNYFRNGNTCTKEWFSISVVKNKIHYGGLRNQIVF